jgi:hypothetical protein
MDKIDAMKQQAQAMIDRWLHKNPDAPIEAMGFRRDVNPVVMPTIEHELSKKKPDFVTKDLEGWELLK